MARARFIRPEFFTDDKVSNLSLEARLLFMSIWCQCDLRGVFEWNPKVLRVQTFPHDESINLQGVTSCLNELVAHRMVVQFDADGKGWGFVRKFHAYQTCATSEKKHGTLRPAPPMTLVRPKSDSSQSKVIPLTPTLTPTPALEPIMAPEAVMTPALRKAQPRSPVGLAPMGGPATGISAEEEIARATSRARIILAERNPLQLAQPELTTINGEHIT